MAAKGYGGELFDALDDFSQQLLVTPVDVVIKKKL